MSTGNTTNDRLTKLESGLANISQEVANIRSDIASLAQAQNASRITNWPLVMTIIGAGAAVLGGLYSTLASRQENMSLKAELEMVRYVQPVVVSSEQSKADRGMLHDRVQDNNTKLTALAGKVDAHYAEARSTVAEIEAQFRNVGNTQNLRYQEISRLLGLLWQKAYNEPLPPPSFYPDAHRDIMQR